MYPMYKPNILVICGKNKRRSRTAEQLYRADARLKVRSAGLSPQSTRKISEQDLAWADIVLVMETDHRSKIRQLYAHIQLPAIQVLNIPDEYDFMDEELVALLTDKMEEVLLDMAP